MYGFQHKTSCPHFPQANGEAEWAIKTIKQLLMKAEDPYQALLVYHATASSEWIIVHLSC